MKDSIKEILRLIRPLQWLKNGFVFTGLLFSQNFLDPFLVLTVCLDAFAFCLISSMIYVINDIVDADLDRNHPTKKKRPIAAGKISVIKAIGIATVLGITGFSIGFWISSKVVMILILYVILNLAYSFYLKNIVLIDVFCISAGFMLRILAGTIGIGIPPSKWLLLCGMMITLFLGFAKRRAEIIALGRNKKDVRRVLANYGPILLDEITAICATGVIITYSLYTMSPDTMRIHKTENLIYTVPFVIYALFRYIFLLHHRNVGGEPSRELVKDPHILIAVAGWFLTTAYLFISSYYE